MDEAAYVGRKTMTVRAVRLQLSRRKDFNLQELSLAINGLLAIVVARPTVFGSRWKIGDRSNFLGRRVETARDAITCFAPLAWPAGRHRALI
jgi:hypothetical protein